MFPHTNVVHMVIHCWGQPESRMGSGSATRLWTTSPRRLWIPARILDFVIEYLHIARDALAHAIRNPYYQYLPLLEGF